MQLYISFNDSFSHGGLGLALGRPFKTKITKALISRSTCPVARIMSAALSLKKPEILMLFYPSHLFLLNYRCVPLQATRELI